MAKVFASYHNTLNNSSKEKHINSMIQLVDFTQNFVTSLGTKVGRKGKYKLARGIKLCRPKQNVEVSL